MSIGKGGIEIGETFVNPSFMKMMKTSVFPIVIGLCTCFLISTVFQERLYSFRGYNGDKFESAPLLALVKGASSVVVSRTIIYFGNHRERVKPEGSPAITVAFIRCSSTILSLYSLNFIGYPYLVLSKSIKILPVLVSEIIFNRKVPSVRRCFSVFMTTAGTIFFSLPALFSGELGSTSSTSLGFFLVFMSLCADGGLSFFQKRMVNDNEEKPSVLETMYCIGKWQVLFLFMVLMISWDGKDLDFCLQNPEVMSLMVWHCLIESVGQVFIYELVIHHGPFVTAMVTTLRKFVTILLSILIFGHPVTTTQWLSMLLVFLGVSININYI